MEMIFYSLLVGAALMVLGWYGLYALGYVAIRLSDWFYDVDHRMEEPPFTNYRAFGLMLLCAAFVIGFIILLIIFAVTFLGALILKLFI